MTTTVKVEAHCASNKEVIVLIEEGQTGSSAVLQDGEKREFYVYDARRIIVLEAEKPSVDNRPDSAG